MDVVQKRNEVKPLWENLRKTHTKLKGDSEDNYIGLLLCSLNIFPNEKEYDRPLLIDNKNYKKYKLVSLIYMAKDLTNVSSGCVISPYVKLHFNGQPSKPTKIDEKTLNPVWGTSLFIETLINEDLSLSDNIKLSCWDNSNLLSGEQCIGRCEINLIEIKKYNNVNYIENDLYKYAKWYQLYDGVQPINGKILAAFFIIRLVKQGKEDINISKYKFWPSEEYYRVCLHIIGVRKVPKDVGLIGGAVYARFDKKELEANKEEFFKKTKKMDDDNSDNNINNMDVII